MQLVVHVHCCKLLQTNAYVTNLTSRSRSAILDASTNVSGESAMEFLVQVDGEEVKEPNEESPEYGNMVPAGRWVFGVDVVDKKFLVNNSENGFCWVPISQCKLMGTSAGQPKPVFVVQPGKPKPKSGLAIVRGSGLPQRGNNN